MKKVKSGENGKMVEKSSEDGIYEIACAVCGCQENLCHYPHRLNNKVVGILEVCRKHRKDIEGKYIKFEVKEQ